MHGPLQISITAESPECVPEYATDWASGMDLKANEALELAPMERRAVGTGIRMAIPEGYEGQVRPRSGLALKQGVGIPNAPGTIDADYRGEVKVILINLSTSPVTIKQGDRIAQLVICPIVRAELLLSGELPETERGAGGFGSTEVSS
jgi:dUTP pyrophosphatase